LAASCVHLVNVSSVADDTSYNRFRFRFIFRVRSRVSRFSPGLSSSSRPADYFRLRQRQSRSGRRHRRRDELFLDDRRRSTRRRRQRSSSSSAGSSAQNDDIAIHDALVGCRTVETFSRELLLRAGCW